MDLLKRVPISVLCFQARCLRGWTREEEGRVAEGQQSARTSRTAHDPAPFASECAWLRLHLETFRPRPRSDAMPEAGSTIRHAVTSRRGALSGAPGFDRSGRSGLRREKNSKERMRAETDVQGKDYDIRSWPRVLASLFGRVT